MTAAHMTNPFDAAGDADRHSIWQILMARDSEAFVKADWSMIETDFDALNFEGIRCFNSANPDEWRIVFPRLSDYRDAWLLAAREFLKKKFADCSHLEAVYLRSRLDEIEINGEIALAYKKFSGELKYEDDTTLSGSRQTLYRLRKRDGRWKIVGFLGYLPFSP
jgi:hypothetical protein